MKSMIDFMRGLRKFPLSVQAWLMVLGLSNMMVPLFFLGRFEAQVMLGTTILSFGLGVVLFKIQGMTKLLGLMHAPWIAPAYLIIRNFSSIDTVDFYTVWMGAALVLTCISLLIDAVDVMKYIAGERGSLV
jgi:hypothetical protein